MTLSDAYAYSAMFLEKNGIDEADFKALCCVCSLAKIKNSEYPLHKQDFVSDKRLADMLWRLKAGEPLQYVLGSWDFYESEFFVGKGVLIPRPETEELVERASEYIEKLGKCIVLDLCSGSGCIGISIAKKCKNAFVYLIEKSSDAMPYLKKNAKNVNNTQIICADITKPDGLEAVCTADVIVSNPPYIKSSEIELLQKEVLREPRMALDGGKDGLDFYRAINDNWYDKLKSGGRLFLEIGNDEGESAAAVLNKFDNVRVIRDMYSNDRIVTAEKNKIEKNQLK